jgi:short-subunit dehydrogenase involved in D-alanine esterification of teichoic acids
MQQLHPAIQHISADKMTDEMIEAINIMVEKVHKMTTKEINDLIIESKMPQHIKDARSYVLQCESDMGFMGSPQYNNAKKAIHDYFEPIRQKQKEDQERETYITLKSKYEPS